MFKTLCTYCPTLMLAVAGLFLACLVFDEYRDANQSVCISASILDSFSIDDVDLDENELDVAPAEKIVRRSSSFNPLPILHLGFCISTNAIMSKDMKLGLVRRYLPRNFDFSWVNYALLKTIITERMMKY